MKKQREEYCQIHRINYNSLENPDGCPECKHERNQKEFKYCLPEYMEYDK